MPREPVTAPPPRRFDDARRREYERERVRAWVAFAANSVSDDPAVIVRRADALLRKFDERFSEGGAGVQ